MNQIYFTPEKNRKQWLHKLQTCSLIKYFLLKHIKKHSWFAADDETHHTCLYHHRNTNARAPVERRFIGAGLGVADRVDSMQKKTQFLVIRI